MLGAGQCEMAMWDWVMSLQFACDQWQWSGGGGGGGQNHETPLKINLSRQKKQSIRTQSVNNCENSQN